MVQRVVASARFDPSARAWNGEGSSGDVVAGTDAQSVAGRVIEESEGGFKEKKSASVRQRCAPSEVNGRRRVTSDAVAGRR